MKKHVITKSQLNDKNEYIGEVDLTDYDGSLEAESGLGYVKFSSICVKFYIHFADGTGIKAGGGIKAGWGIEAGTGIKAGGGIEAGWGIEAGGGIEAGWGIKAGLSISAKFISSKLRIFAGLCAWKIPSTEEMEIRAELREGIICFGKLVEQERGAS